MKRLDKILNKRDLMFFDTKYDEKKIDSFNQMNALLRCVLLFFILGTGGGAVYVLHRGATV